MTHAMTGTEYNDHVRRQWSEATFQANVVRRARELGWLVQHSRKAKTPQGHRTPITGHKGYPDITLARAGRIIIAELKTETGTVDAAQRRWLEALAGFDGWPNYGAETVDRHTNGTGILRTTWDATGRHRLWAVAVWRPRHWATITGILTND